MSKLFFASTERQYLGGMEYFSRQNVCLEIFSGARPAQDLEDSILRRPIHILMCNEWQEKNKVPEGIQRVQVLHAMLHNSCHKRL